MELKDTIEMMTSDDYRERFKAEYWQLKIRLERLEKVLCQKDFVPTCPIYTLICQRERMQEYLSLLRRRADIEDIDLEE